MNRQIDRLRNVAGETRVTLADVASQLEAVLEEHPDMEWAIDRIAGALRRMPPTPPIVTNGHRWTWPRPDWETWQQAVSTDLGSFPDSMWRSIVMNVPKYPGTWLQIAGSFDGFSVQIYDPQAREDFADLAKLAWSPSPDEPHPGLFWECDRWERFAEPAVDLAAQALALALQLEPGEVIIEDITF